MTDTNGAGAKSETDTTLVPRTELDRIAALKQKSDAELMDYKRRFEGIDPDRVKADREALAALERESAAGDPKKIDELVSKASKDIETRFAGALESEKTARTKAEAELHQLRVVNGAMSVIAPQLNADAVPLIEGIVAKQCGWVDGKLVVLDADGKPRYSAGNPSVPMSVEEYAKELSGRHPSCFKATHVAGARDGVEQRSNGARTIDLKTASYAEQKEHFKNNPDEAKRVVASR